MCANKKHSNINCKASSPAIETEEEGGNIRYFLSRYSDHHVIGCHANSALLAVRNIKEAIRKRVQESPTIKPSIVYNEEVNRIRDNLPDDAKDDFDDLMPSQVSMNPSIHGWKREVIIVNPDSVLVIDEDNIMFKTSAGESICKFDLKVVKPKMRMLELFPTDKVLEAGLKMSNIGVMDATFDVSMFQSYVFF